MQVCLFARVRRRSGGRLGATSRSAVAMALGLAVLAGPGPAALAGRPSTSLPQTSMSGSTGLVRIPTAEVMPYGYCVLGLNLVDSQHRYYEGKNTLEHFATVGILPRVELTAGMVNIDGRLGAQFRQDLDGGVGGWNFDRMLSVQASLLRQTPRCPVAVGAGWQDIVGTGDYRVRYLSASHRWRQYGIHLGLGQRYRKNAHQWRGEFFGGVDCQPAPNVRLMLDHDGMRFNVGATVEFYHFGLTPVLTGMSKLGGGITYTWHL